MSVNTQLLPLRGLALDLSNHGPTVLILLIVKNMTNNCYINPTNKKAAKFLMEKGYSLTPGVKDVYDVLQNCVRSYCVLYVNFKGSGMAFHKLLIANNLLSKEPLKPFAFRVWDIWDN